MVDREQLLSGLKKGVMKELIEEYGKSEKEANEMTKSIRLPSKVKFICDGDLIRIAMSMEGAENRNMQADDAAFEGWALLLHVHLNKNVQLNMEGERVPDWGRGRLHFNRFLYRLKKFNELYGGRDGWFSVEEKLSKVMEDFDHYLFASGATFRNNIADGPAGIGRGAEARVEVAFADRPDLLRAYSVDLYRQLPVGLFEGSAAEGNSIFTGKKSAIDLWGLGEDTSGTQLVIYELKARNKMVGIISELMFYANYTYDMYVERKNFRPSLPPIRSKGLRGYERLADAAITGIRAYMLTDGLHPLITPKVLGEMNRGNICYGALEYDWAEKDGGIAIKGVKSCF